MCRVCVLPTHSYVTRKLAASESITIDGKLDDAAWEAADWTYDMIDITRHSNQALNAVPNDVQAGPPQIITSNNNISPLF